MAKVQMEEEFPCGYRMSMKVSSVLRNIDLSNFTLGNPCPLHGKDCPPKRRKR